MTAIAEQPNTYADWLAYQEAHRALQRGRKHAKKTPKRELEVFVDQHDAITLDDFDAAPELVELPKLKFARGEELTIIVVAGVKRYRMGDDDASRLGAIRHPRDYGTEEIWSVDGHIGGKRVRKLYRGTIAALRMMWPDRATRNALKKAGCMNLHQLGAPIQIDIPRRI
jgi:hypothetical protein